jgi:hypothetical protein
VQARPRIVTVYEKASGAAPYDDWMHILKDLIGRSAIEREDRAVAPRAAW